MRKRRIIRVLNILSIVCCIGFSISACDMENGSWESESGTDSWAESVIGSQEDSDTGEGNSVESADGDSFVEEETPTEHQHTAVIDEAVEATCTENGKTEGSHCSICGEVIVAQQEVEASGHTVNDGRCAVCGYLVPTDGLEYTLSTDGTLYNVSGVGSARNKTEIIISGEYNGKPVTAISSYALQDCSKLQRVVIGEGVKVISTGAFYACEKLTEIQLPESLTRIADYAFADCSQLKNIEIPESVNNIGESAFHGCSNLESMSLPSLEKEITVSWRDFDDRTHYASFGYIFGKESYTNAKACHQYNEGKGATRSVYYYMPKSLKTVTIVGDTLARGAFYNCSTLEKIILSDGITCIGENTFYGCGDVDFNFPVSVTSIGASAFEMSELTDITIPNEIKEIGNSAFANCENLTDVVIGNGVEFIGESAFFQCENLARITIGSGVQEIGNNAFYECRKLCYVNIIDLGKWCATDCKNVQSSPFVFGAELYVDNQRIEKLIIPDGVTALSSFAFVWCSSITEIEISNGVEKIGKQVFYGCENVIGVVIPVSITNIEDYAFGGCDGMTRVYYRGTQAQWKGVVIGKYNTSLENAVFEYNG